MSKRFGGLLAIGLIVVACGSAATPSPSPSPTPSPSPRPTLTATPTVTPTLPPVIPTDTPVPVRTPTANPVAKCPVASVGPGQAGQILGDALVAAGVDSRPLADDSAAPADPTPTPPPPAGTPTPAPTKAGVTVPPGTKTPVLAAGPSDNRVVAFTVDDDYTPSVVRAEMAIFLQQHVNATFFPVGNAVYQWPDLWKDVAAAGFPIGTHTLDHKDLTTLTYDQMVTEIEAGNYAIKSATGKSALKILRPPYGHWNPTVQVAAHTSGELAIVTWNTSVDDATDISVPLMINHGELGKPGSIILMHGNSNVSVQALPAIIAFYRSCGFRFVSVAKLIGLDDSETFPDEGDASPTPSFWL